MDDNFYEYSDNFGDGESASWTERDWRVYLKKADDEILKFAAAYSLRRNRGMSLEEIAQYTGWAIPENFDDDSDESGPSFAYEPWTIFNHPIFIVSKGLIRCLREHLRRVIEESDGTTGIQAWNLSTEIASIENCLELAINSTDLGEDTLARCNYKTAAFKLNAIFSALSKIPVPDTPEAKERMKRINNIIMDMRQLCLDLSDRSRVQNKKF